VVNRRSVDRPLVEPFAGLLGEAPGTSRSFHIEPLAIALDDELRLAEPISGDGRAARTNRGLFVQMQLGAALDERCSRCLDPVVSRLDVRIEEEVLPSLALATGQRLDAASEPEALRLDDHHRLDLEPLIREAISLAEPIAPLCRPDCPGLCPMCGARLADAGRHEHVEDAIDPRLAVLRGFSVDAGDETG
jgi:uncharacterized protein